MDWSYIYHYNRLMMLCLYCISNIVSIGTMLLYNIALTRYHSYGRALYSSYPVYARRSLFTSSDYRIDLEKRQNEKRLVKK